MDFLSESRACFIRTISQCITYVFWGFLPAPTVLSLHSAQLQKAVTTNFLSWVYEDTCWTFVDMASTQSSKESISSLSMVTVEDMRESRNTRKTKCNFWGFFFIGTTSSLVVHHHLKRQMAQSVVEKWNERSSIYLRWRCFLTAQPIRNLNM